MILNKRFAMKTKIILFAFFSLILFSCIREPKFERYIGTWQPAYNQEQQLISRIQFMKLKDFYIVGIEYNEKILAKNEVFFYVCEMEKNYFIIRPSNYFYESSFYDIVLTRPTKVYYDPEFNNLYVANSVYKASPKRIFQYANNELKILTDN